MPATLDANVYGSRRKPSFEDGFQELGHVPWSDDVFESCDLIEADPAPRMKVCARRSPRPTRVRIEVHGTSGGWADGQ
jgi:hypothetical protein